MPEFIGGPGLYVMDLYRKINFSLLLPTTRTQKIVAKTKTPSRNQIPLPRLALSRFEGTNKCADSQGHRPDSLTRYASLLRLLSSTNWGRHNRTYQVKSGTEIYDNLTSGLPLHTFRVVNLTGIYQPRHLEMFQKNLQVEDILVDDCSVAWHGTSITVSFVL